MKSKIEESRLFQEKLNINNGEFPLYVVKPERESETMIFFITGLNGNGTMINYWNYDFLKDFFVVSADQRAQGNNKSKPFRSYKKYLEDIHLMIDYCKKKYGIKKVFLTGESWGSALAVHYYNKYSDVDGIFIWNMPYSIKSITKVPFKQAAVRNLKMIATFAFHIETFDEAPFVNELTNDPVLLRIIKAVRNTKMSNKVIIASWRSFKPAWRILNKKNDWNYLYVQSKNDVVANIDKVLLWSENNKKIKIFEDGVHILSFDKFAEEDLFKEMKSFVLGK